MKNRELKISNFKLKIGYIRWIISRRLILVLILFFNSCLLFPAYTYAVDSNPSSPPFSNGGQGEFFNKVIKVIEVQGLTRIKDKELTGLVGFNTGDILDKKELSTGIRRAFKKDIFLDIQVVSEPYEDGIKLRYIVKEIPVIKKIAVKGNRNLSDRKIKKIFLFREDEDFREELLDEARLALVEFYQRKGFPDAAVKLEVKNAKEPSMVRIYVNIEEGAPLIIKSIDTPLEAKRRLTLSEGKIFDRDVLDKDINRLRNYYKKDNYIKPVIGPYKFRDSVLTIPVNKGPKLELIFKGNSAVSARKLKKEAPFMDDEEVSDETIEEAVNRIKRLYLSKGYYYARIAAAVERKENKIRVSFFIIEGQKVILRKINFEGISISAGAAKEVISLEENKPYNENLLHGSRESLINFYNALGYLKMEVTGIKKEFHGNGSELNLKFIVNEGKQIKIDAIKIDGNRYISRFEIKRALRLSEGSPYNAADIRDARYRALSLYSRYGYPDARVDVESVIDTDKAVLHFRITENMPFVIGKIILRGNRKTKAKIIRREFTIEEGEPYNYEEILKTKQRLYKLGLFNEVSIDALDSEREISGSLVKDLVVSLKEGKAGFVEIGLGYADYEKLRGSLDVRYNNLGGYNRQIGLRAEVSSVEKKYIFNFREPWLFNEPDIPFNVFLMKEDARAVNLDTNETLYKIDRLSLLIGIEKELTGRLRASLNFEYSLTDTTEVEPDVILSKEDTGTIGIGSISPSLFYDTRDDPFDPSSGSLHGIILKFASEAFLSEMEFIKGTLQSSWFFQLRRGIVLALSFRGGAAYSFDETQELPLIERFFLGGRTTVRGYSQDTLGPKGADGNPTGGNMFSLVNGELRISLGKGFGLVAFLDSGNVWTLAKDTDTRMKYTAGAGLRYNTPVGPVRIDYGHKLSREEDESPGEVHFSLGHAF